MMKRVVILMLAIAATLPIAAATDYIQNVYGRQIQMLNGKWGAIVDQYDRGLKKKMTEQGRLADTCLTHQSRLGGRTEVVGEVVDDIAIACGIVEGDIVEADALRVTPEPHYVFHRVRMLRSRLLPATPSECQPHQR